MFSLSMSLLSVQKILMSLRASHTQFNFKVFKIGEKTTVLGALRISKKRWIDIEKWKNFANKLPKIGSFIWDKFNQSHRVNSFNRYSSELGHVYVMAVANKFKDGFFGWIDKNVFADKKRNFFFHFKGFLNLEKSSFQFEPILPLPAVSLIKLKQHLFSASKPFHFRLRFCSAEPHRTGQLYT